MTNLTPNRIEHRFAHLVDVDACNAKGRGPGSSPKSRPSREPADDFTSAARVVARSGNQVSGYVRWRVAATTPLACQVPDCHPCTNRATIHTAAATATAANTNPITCLPCLRGGRHQRSLVHLACSLVSPGLFATASSLPPHTPLLSTDTCPFSGCCTQSSTFLRRGLLLLLVVVVALVDGRHRTLT